MQGASVAWARALRALAASSSSGWEAATRGIGDDKRAAHARRRLVDALGVPVHAGQLGARERGRDGERAGSRPARRRHRLGDVHDPAAAQRHVPPVAGRQRVERRRGERRHGSLPDVMHDGGRPGQGGRRGERPLRRQQGEARPAGELHRLGRAPAAEGDDALAVAPGPAAPVYAVAGDADHEYA